LKQIFVYDPSKRLTAREALRHPWFNEKIKDEGETVDKLRMERLPEMERELRRRRHGSSDTEPEEDGDATDDAVGDDL
jgi:dual-specificity kinase